VEVDPARRGSDWHQSDTEYSRDEAAGESVWSLTPDGIKVLHQALKLERARSQAAA